MAPIDSARWPYVDFRNAAQPTRRRITAPVRRERRVRSRRRTDAPDMLVTLALCLTYLADLNGSEWIKGDGSGEQDMRQRAKRLQTLAFKAVSAADPARYGVKS